MTPKAENSKAVVADLSALVANLPAQKPNPEFKPTPEIAQAEAFSRLIARTHYENFSIASWLLPRSLQQDFYNVYAFCRWSDDLADELGDPEKSRALLSAWEFELNECRGGVPRNPILLALQQTVNRHAIPKQLFTDLLSAFQQDQFKTRYNDEVELLNYCTRSANPVGRIVLTMAQVEDADCLELSDSICTGLQIANFCQDMSRDAAQDRIYAPRTLQERHQVNDAMILERKVTPQLRNLLRDWCGSSRNFLTQGQDLAARVPRWLAVDINLFTRGGLAILKAIEAQHYDVWSHRPTVSKLRKTGLFVQSVFEHYFSRLKRSSKTE